MSCEGILPILAAALPLAGIALSWWSFKFAEVGSTPDRWPEQPSLMDLSAESLDRGARERARICARVTFNTGALCLASAVPLGNPGAHCTNGLTPLAFAGFAIVAISIGYAVYELYLIWQNRREKRIRCVLRGSNGIVPLQKYAGGSRAVLRSQPDPLERAVASRLAPLIGVSHGRAACHHKWAR